tara:strand:- start:884 stop:1360 length:477 start_codon:yes stop_codon:yes gene_type:complete
MRARFLIFFIVISLAFLIFKLSFLSNKTIYSDYYNIPNNQWLLKDTLIFNLPMEQQSINQYNIQLFGKINQDYLYSNLFLFVDLYSENKKIKRDTLSILMYDSFGKPVQKNIGNTQFFNLNYLPTFKINKNYKLKIVHGMRNDKLNGVESIGLKIKVK